MDGQLNDVIATEAQLRAVLGYPGQRALDKQIDTLDEHCRAYIAASPFVLIGTGDAAGNMDVSPKGDLAGFVHVLDEKTLAIPDRPGNRRADTLRNLIQNPHIGLLFLVPGQEQTLRVNGTALIARDRWLREKMAVSGKLPELAFVVSVREVFFHCAKCMVRSKLWDNAHWPSAEGVPTLAEALIAHANLDISETELAASLERDTRERLF